MEEGNDAEWIVSRKIVVKSLTRHFAPWKSRFFVLDRAQALLGVRSSSNDALLVISLSSQSLSVQRHEYSVDDQYLLTVKYRDEESPTSKEIVMKFESIGHLTYWEKVFYLSTSIHMLIYCAECNFDLLRLYKARRPM